MYKIQYKGLEVTCDTVEELDRLINKISVQVEPAIIKKSNSRLNQLMSNKQFKRKVIEILTKNQEMTASEIVDKMLKARLFGRELKTKVYYKVYGVLYYHTDLFRQNGKKWSLVKLRMVKSA